MPTQLTNRNARFLESTNCTVSAGQAKYIQFVVWVYVGVACANERPRELADLMALKTKCWVRGNNTVQFAQVRAVQMAVDPHLRGERTIAVAQENILLCEIIDSHTEANGVIHLSLIHI